jgi:hypothetical protein
MTSSRSLRAILLLSVLASAAPAVAQFGWGHSRIDRVREPALSSSSRDPREGQVDAARFIADGAGDQLGKGGVEVSILSGAVDDVAGHATYEAALIDQLVTAGYDTLAPQPVEGAQDASGQIAELRIRREVLVPKEGKRKPVSGEMMVGTGTHGSMMGLGLAIDLTKPKQALVSTRMETRIIDKVTGAPLWEGRAEISTREGDSRWNNQAIATRLAEAMFERFPHGPARVVSR